MKYREYLLGVVSDVEFPHGGELTPEAGFMLARMIHDTVPDVPIVLQSSRTEFIDRAHGAGYGFLQKRSPTLLGDLRNILTEEMGFGDFVFHLPDGKTEVARASDLNALENLLHTGAAREPGVSRPAQSFFALADGANRVCPGAEASPSDASATSARWKSYVAT